ncbi:MAG: hypothetical protein Q9222_003170 [Ikaeria aurantiellina]
MLLHYKGVKPIHYTPPPKDPKSASTDFSRSQAEAARKAEEAKKKQEGKPMYVDTKSQGGGYQKWMDKIKGMGKGGKSG